MHAGASCGPAGPREREVDRFSAPDDALGGRACRRSAEPLRSLPTESGGAAVALGRIAVLSRFHFSNTARKDGL